MTKSRKSASGTEAAAQESAPAAQESAPAAQGPAPAAEPAPEAQEPAPEAEPTVTADDRTADRPGREPGDLLVAMSPRQIIGGFAVLAGLILMLRRRRRDKG